MAFVHKSVLFREAVDALNIRPDGIYMDLTAGGGGHSAAVLDRLGGRGRLICVDQDPDAIAALTARFSGDGRVTIVQRNFSQVREIAHALGLDGIDGVLMDLGVSSHQLDTPERGFSFHRDPSTGMHRVICA